MRNAATRRECPFDDVIAQHDDDLLAVGEVFRQSQRVGNAAFAFLVGVIDVGKIEGAAVAEQPQEVAGVIAARDDQQVADAGIDERLDGIENHRLVVNRQKMLVGDLGQRREPRAQTAGENDAFHDGYLEQIQCRERFGVMARESSQAAGSSQPWARLGRVAS